MAIIHCDYLNGNDTTGTGTSGAPYKTLSKAFSVVVLGDSVKIANTTAQPVSSALAFPAAAFTVDRYFIIEGWDNGGAETIQKPSGNITAVGAISGVGHASGGAFGSPIQFVLWKNIKFQNYTAGTGLFTSSNPARNIFYNCDFNNNSMFLMGMGTETIIQNCSFRTCTNTSGIIGSTSSHARFLHNYVYDSYFISTSGLGPVVAYNIFDRNRGDSVRIGNGDMPQIFHNTFIGVAGAASRLGINCNDSGTEMISIYNNHFQNFSGAGAAAIKHSTSSAAGTPGAFAMVGGNSFYNNTANYEAPTTNLTASTLIDLRSLDVVESADPLVNAASLDFRFKNTATAYKAGGIMPEYPYTATASQQTPGAAVDDDAAGGSSGGSFTFS